MDKRYNQEFKESTIQLVLNSDKSSFQIAKELAIANDEKEILKKAT